MKAVEVEAALVVALALVINIMTSCILTVIKDEHLYLEEWIKYHLNIGVFHIFILEDINSKPHKDITNTYNNVTLIPALSILSNEEKDLVLANRANNIPGGQKTYIKAGLKYIKENYDYDWCFVIDNDEFITLEQGKTLNKIFSLYDNYDAFIMSWKCYGANGFIKTPYYSIKGVVDTYTKPITGYVPHVFKDEDKKICFNLKKYQPIFWHTNHIPSNECNFCNTDFQKDKNKITYNNVYIRHYITKSWEEYVWKKKTRGYFYGAQRTFDNFFKINLDMLPWKETLKAQIEDETLVILPYCNAGQGNEIKLALSSWKKFCQFKYHFVVIGEFNEQLIKEFNWVEFIYEPRIPKVKDQYNPHLDIIHKMEIAYNKFKDTYPGFIYTCDDFYAIKPFDIEDVTNIYYHQLTFTGVKDLPTSYWKHDKWKTRQLLDKEHLPHINYTAHHPCYFNFERFKKIWDKYNMYNESYVLEDVYFNSFEHQEPLLDSTIRLGIWNHEIFIKEFENTINNPAIKFVCNSVEGWSNDLENALWKLIR